MSLDLPQILSRFTPAPGTTYLDSATYGLPPRSTLEACRQALDLWSTGEAHWIDDWEREAEVCRGLCAQLLNVEERQVALMPAVSVASGLVATGVPEGGEVLVAEGDFTSVLYPFLAAEKRGLLRVREVPLGALAESVSPRTALVAVSAVQSADGRLADLEAIRDATRTVDARLYVDASQALGVVPLDAAALGIDYLACPAYKWLCCPRGVAFLYVHPERWDELYPLTASWRGGDDPFGRFYGSPLVLAEDAGRFDISLAWHAWVGARASLETLCELNDSTRYALAMEPARVLAEHFGLPEPATPILSVAVEDDEGAAAALAAAQVKVSKRAGRIRLSPHFYNTVEDAERAAEVLGPFVRR